MWLSLFHISTVIVLYTGFWNPQQNRFFLSQHILNTFTYLIFFFFFTKRIGGMLTHKSCHNRLPNAFCRLCLLQSPAFSALFWCLPVCLPSPLLLVHGNLLIFIVKPIRKSDSLYTICKCYLDVSLCAGVILVCPEAFINVLIC